MDIAIDPSSSTPLHIQLRDFLIEAIQAGELSPGDKLPSERILKEQLGISRPTIRQALNELEYAGLIMRRSGKGTYISRPTIVRQLTSSISDDMHRLGVQPSLKILVREILPASGFIASHLNIEAGMSVIRIKRLRLANDVPIGIEDSHLPYHLCQDFMEQDLEKGSIYDCLRQLGYRLSKASQVIKAGLPTDEECKILNLDSGKPVVRLEWTTYIEDGTPIEFVLECYRSDIYQVTTSFDIDQWSASKKI